jgi:hypothetical protein
MNGMPPNLLDVRRNIGDDLWTRVGRCTVGFIGIRDGGLMVSFGSGTLIRFGLVAGVLTCAHVLDALRSESDVGLICFPVPRPNEVQSFRIPMEATEQIVIGSGEPWSSCGPDIAFLRLPAATMASLESMASVVNGDISRQEVLLASKFNVVSGVIANETGQSMIDGPVAVTEFVAAVNAGFVVDTSTFLGMDLFRFQPYASEGGKLPTSYEGTSGGGLWHVSLNPEDNYSVAQVRLCGVAFWQETVNGELHIIGHGPRSLYGPLFEAITKKWPPE